MNPKILLAGAFGLLFGAIGGFLLANGINRTELNALKGQVEQNKRSAGNSNSAPDGFTIGDDEIKAKIAQADANPDNFAFQKNLGGALYRYATMKSDQALIDESMRILIRANSLDPKDYDVIVDLGNAYFDVGYFKKDKASFKKAREMYDKALETKPNDADVRTDIAMSFVLDDPPDFNRAVEEFQRALKANPKQERALQFLTHSYMQLGNFAEAAKTLELLKAANPKNDKIADLASQIANKQPSPIK
jgi:tetratricopeptide (TPR) repeat protein